MANQQAPRDANQVTALLAIDDVTGETVPVACDSDGNLLVVASGGGGSGTVTSVSVVTANGFAGSVATATTTPAITLSTTVTGILSGNGTAISAASTTGSGAVVLATSPALTTPNIGAATATSINGVTITATTGTLNITNGKTLAVTNSLTLSGTDSTVMTFPTTSATIARTDAANTFTGASTASAWVLTSPTITTKISPTSDDGAPLGDTTHNFSDLFLASGAVVNYANSNVVITHSSGILTMGTGELRVTTPGTNSASVPTLGSTSTLTAKRITRRLTTTNAPGATPTTNTDNVDIMNFTGLGTAITSMTTNLSGTPVDGDLVEFRFTDDGSARGITWGASFSATTVALPTTTVISTMLRVLFEWNGSTWACIATA